MPHSPATQARHRVPTPAAPLGAIVDQLKVGLVVIDAANRIVLFNRLAGEMLHQDPDERLGSAIQSCHPFKSVAAVETLIERIRCGALDHHEGWVNYRGRMLYEYIYPLRDVAGDYLGMVDELHDAADRSDLLRRLGEWQDVQLSGVGARAPRPAEFPKGDPSDLGRRPQPSQEGSDA
jgi:PAS domain-containing protein